jgi:hypothetical protein
MAGSKKKISTLLGITMIAFVISNVQFGIIAPIAIDGAPNSTLNVLKLTEPQCSFDAIASSLESSGQSYCLGSTGDWGGVDFLMLLEGLVLVLFGRFKFPKGAAWAARSRKLVMTTGGVLFSLAILDRLQLLPTSVNSTGLAELMPIHLSPWVMQIGIAILGAILLRGPKYWDSEAQQSTQVSIEQRRVIADKFRSTFTPQASAVGADSIAMSRTSNLLKRDKHLSMRKSSYGVKVFATCPYCAGTGCKKCANKGTL